MISGSEHYSAHDEEDKELFVEFLLENNFKMVATRDPSCLPKHQDAVFLHTSNKQLFRRLRNWARQNDAVILYNPERECRDVDFFAVVFDSNLLGTVLLPPTLAGRLINTGLNPELIERTLKHLQPYDSKKK